MLRESQSDDRVLNEECVVLVRDDDEYIEPIHNAKADQRDSERTLAWRLTPLMFLDDPRNADHRDRDSIEVTENTWLYHKDTEEHLKADAFNIVESDDVDCGYERTVTFLVNPTRLGEPRRTVTYYESTLEELLLDGVLVTREQVSDELEELLGIGETA